MTGSSKSLTKSLLFLNKELELVLNRRYEFRTLRTHAHQSIAAHILNIAEKTVSTNEHHLLVDAYHSASKGLSHARAGLQKEAECCLQLASQTIDKATDRCADARAFASVLVAPQGAYIRYRAGRLADSRELLARAYLAALELEKKAICSSLQAYRMQLLPNVARVLLRAGNRFDGRVFLVAGMVFLESSLNEWINLLPEPWSRGWERPSADLLEHQAELHHDFAVAYVSSCLSNNNKFEEESISGPMPCSQIRIFTECESALQNPTMLVRKAGDLIRWGPNPSMPLFVTSLEWLRTFLAQSLASNLNSHEFQVAYEGVTVLLQYEYARSPQLFTGKK